MKKKILAAALAFSAMIGSTAFAQNVYYPADENDTKAILMCYDENGVLVYSNMYKAENGGFNMELPEKYEGSIKKAKAYLVDTKRFKDIDLTADMPAETPAPTQTPSATQPPAATAKPTSEPSQNKFPAIYEKALDAIYAPGVVKEVETREGKDGDVYAVTMLYQGKEVTFGVDTDFGITAAPEAYSFMKDAPAVKLEEGDVICVTTDISGESVRTLDFITRPAAEDIVTGTENYGTNFEKLISANGSSVADKWEVMQYGKKPSSDRYQYAFGVVAKKDSNTVTLLNKKGNTDEAMEISIEKDTIVYTCDTADKNSVEIGSVSDISSSISKKMFDDNKIIWEKDTTYNYALVRVVDGTATDIVLYNNYNE